MHPRTNTCTWPQPSCSSFTRHCSASGQWSLLSCHDSPELPCKAYGSVNFCLRDITTTSPIRITELTCRLSRCTYSICGLPAACMRPFIRISHVNLIHVGVAIDKCTIASALEPHWHPHAGDVSSHRKYLQLHMHVDTQSVGRRSIGATSGILWTL